MNSSQKHPSSKTNKESVEHPKDSRKKDRPTPSRKEAQARNARPIVGNASKEARKAERERMIEQRQRARAGMAAGDERYLVERDKGPQRRWVRQYVDARLNVGEFIIVTMLVVAISTFLPRPIPYYGISIMWAYLAITVLDLIWLTVSLGRKLRAKFGADHVQKGWRAYAVMRALQFRGLRLPRALVKRGEYPE